MKPRRSVTMVIVVLVALGSIGTAGIILHALSQKRETVRRVRNDLGLIRNRVTRLVKKALKPVDRGSPVGLHLPPTPDVADVLESIERCGSKSGVELGKIDVPDTVADGRQSYEIRGRGRANAIASFLAFIEELPRVLVVHELKVVAVRTGAPEFRVHLVAFHETSGGGR